MTTQERKTRIKAKRIKQVTIQKLFILLAITLLITIGSIVCGTIFSSAKTPVTDAYEQKSYKSIMIEHGDSLWSIADEYCTVNSIDKQSYIDELMQVNNLKSENIQSGQYLIVISYETETR